MQLKPLLALFNTLIVTSIASFAHAQTPPLSTRTPVSDNTLSTQVSGANNNFTITGGLNRGKNVFHSFQDFSVPTGGSATFINPAGNRAIITRVTGGNFSDIDGRIDTQGANFFLINPNGMVFGKNTQLNVGQTFVGSTANSIDLVDEGGNNVNFGTSRSGDTQLLTINPNALFTNHLNFGGVNGQITNFGTLQTPNPNQYIGLIGGNVAMNGGRIVALGGRVELGGLSAQGNASLGVDGNNLGLKFPANVARGDVLLTNQAGVFVAGVGGGDVFINARNVEISNASVLSAGIFNGFGTTQTVAGDIKINATGGVVVSNSSIKNDVGLNSRGQGGNIIIDTGSISLVNAAQITALTQGEGNAGNINMKAKDSVSLAIGSAIFSNVERGAVGNGGNIIINAGTFSLRDGSQLQTVVRPASNIQKAGQGNAGNINIKVIGNADISGANDRFLSQVSSSVEVGAIGNSGNIDIDAGSFSLKDGGTLQSSNSGKKGNAGNITLKIAGSFDISRAGEIINIFGLKQLFVSGINSFIGIGTVGDAGNITINANSVSLRDGAQLQSSTFGIGNAGNVILNANDAISFAGANTGVLSNIEPNAVGKGGNIEINGDSLSLKDGAQLQTIIREPLANQLGGKGAAGYIKIKVAGAVDIIGAQEVLDSLGKKQILRSAIASSVGNNTEGSGGDITIEAGSFSLRDGARISASTFGQGSGGNINIITKDNISLTGGSAIFTSVEAGGQGKGGNIDITAASLSFQDASQLVSSTAAAFDSKPAGKGNTGNISVKVNGSVDLAGTREVLDPSGSKQIVTSGISSSLNGTEGNGGNITIDAGSISLKDGAQFRATTFGEGNAGTITVNATDFVTIAGKVNSFSSGLFVTSLSPTGAAGDIIVISPKITLDSGSIDARSALGKGGNIQIGGKIPAQFASIQGSQINANETKLISLRRGARISTDAGGTFQQDGNGGNIVITAPSGFIVTAPNENSDISANGFTGSGGKVNINTQQNFWIFPLSRTELQQRVGTTAPDRLDPANLPTNDITAISQVNPNLSGQVNITPPEIDPSRGLSPLPTTAVDLINQINPNCSPKALANNSFTSVGKGGLPDDPRKPLQQEPLVSSWVKLNPQDQQLSTPVASLPTTPQPFDSAQGKLLVEASGWRREWNGDVVLFASSSGNLPHPPQPQAGCVDR